MTKETENQLRVMFGEPGTAEALEAARIAAGWPKYGVEMNEDTLVQEANLDELNAVSYNKGCYTGQETVARVHFRGRVNKHLRHISSTVAITPGSLLRTEDGKEVGDVRSSAVLPESGPIAVAMVRREVEPGQTLHTASKGNPIECQVQK